VEPRKKEKEIETEKRRAEDPRLTDPSEYDDDMDFHRADSPPKKADGRPKTNSQQAQT
jgi:hypothetical protein